MRLFLRTLLTTAYLASLSWADVIELGVDNLASTIKSKTWHVVLFYDKNNEKDNKELDQLMTGLNNIFANNTSLGFAKLDSRRHPAYRQAYKFPGDSDPLIHNYYDLFPDQAENIFVVSHETFMNFGEIYWPSKIALFANNFNVYSELDLDFKAQAQVKIDICARWIEHMMFRQPEDLEEIIISPINQETERILEKEAEDNSFTFSKYFKSLPAVVGNKEEEQGVRFLLEAGASKNADVDRDGHYTYEPLYPDDDDSEDLL